MTILTWLLVGLNLFAVFAAGLMIGKPREALTPGAAMFSAILSTVTVVALLYWMLVK